MTVVGPDGTTQRHGPEAWASFDADRLANGQILAGVMMRRQSSVARTTRRVPGRAFDSTIRTSRW